MLADILTQTVDHYEMQNWEQGPEFTEYRALLSAASWFKGTPEFLEVVCRVTNELPMPDLYRLFRLPTDPIWIEYQTSPFGRNYAFKTHEQEGCLITKLGEDYLFWSAGGSERDRREITIAG